MYVVGLDRGRMVDPAVLANGAAEAARVIGTTVRSGKCANVSKPLASIG